MRQCRRVRIGTRGSPLAMWQAEYVAGRLREACPGLAVEVVAISTRGDRVAQLPPVGVGAKGLFTEELESALRREAIDLAVHSLKDLPVLLPDDLEVSAVAVRTDPADALVSRTGVGLMDLPSGAVVGCSSERRKAQIARVRRDLAVRVLRGNIGTRLAKLDDDQGDLDAIVVAWAALERLGLADRAAEVLSEEVMMPAPGQGAIAVESKRGTQWAELARSINDPRAELETVAEREFLRALGGGCSVPVGARGQLDVAQGILQLRGRVLDPLGTWQLDVTRASSVPGSLPMPTGEPKSDNGAAIAVAMQLGEELAAEALRLGAGELLAGRCVEAVRTGRSGGAGSVRMSPGGLAGKRVVNTRSPHQAAKLDSLLLARGAVPLSYPCIDIAPPRDASALLAAVSALNKGEFEWVVFPSANAVYGFAQAMKEVDGSGRACAPTQVAAVGPETAETVRAVLGLQVSLCPRVFDKEALASCLKEHRPASVLLVQGDLASDELTSELRKGGARVTSVQAYRTVLGQGGVSMSQLLAEGKVDALVFTSPSTVSNFFARIEAETQGRSFLRGACVACIGPATARAAAVHGLEVAVQPDRHTLEALVEALDCYFSEQGGSSKEGR